MWNYTKVKKEKIKKVYCGKFDIFLQLLDGVTVSTGVVRWYDCTSGIVRW